MPRGIATGARGQNISNLIAYAESFYGVPYIYGGNNRLIGLDCSGFVCEVLRAGGFLEDDYSSQMLLDEFLSDWTMCKPQRGAIAFFGKSLSQIQHCSFCLSTGFVIEAGGGDSETLSVEKDKKSLATHVRMRPVNARKDLVTCLMPIY